MKNTKAIALLTFLISLLPFSSFAASLNSPLQTVTEVPEASILPSVVNALGLGDSAEADFFGLAAYSAYSAFNFRKYTHLPYDLFTKAYKGYLGLRADNMISNPRYLTIIDFELPSTAKRLWVLDMENQKVVINDLVSHGRNSGENYASSFSNQPESFQSSLGFYITGAPYMGKNDYSLRLHGVEEGFNDNAFDRGIVMHGAEYVSHSYIRQHHRIGRSQGCPAVPTRLNQHIINTIQGGSCLFIYYPDRRYLSQSEILNRPNPEYANFADSNIALNLP